MVATPRRSEEPMMVFLRSNIMEVNNKKIYFYGIFY